LAHKRFVLASIFKKQTPTELFKKLNPGFVFLMNIKQTLLLVSWDSNAKLEIQDFGDSGEDCKKTCLKDFSVDVLVKH